MTASELDKLDIVVVIQRTFGVIGRNFAAFAILALLLVGLPDLLVSLLQTEQIGGLGSIEDLNEFARGPSVFFAGLASLVTGAILQGALVSATVQDLDGRRTTVSQSLATGLRAFLAIIGIAILFGLGVAAGLILLVVPGVMLLCAWAVVIPAFLAERTTIIGAFGRSAELTRGARWRIFGLLVVWLAASAVVSWIVGLGILGSAWFSGDFFGAVFSPFSLLVSAVVSAATAMVIATSSAVLYVELRRRRDGPDSNWMANILA